MAFSNVNAELSFADIQIDDVFTSGGIIQTLKKYDKFLEIYVSDPANRDQPLPAKIVKDKVVNNDLIRRWASFKAPPLLLTFICGGLTSKRRCWCTCSRNCACLHPGLRT